MTAADFTNLHLQYKSQQAEGEVPAAIEHDFDAGRMVDHYFVTPSPAFWEDEGIREQIYSRLTALHGEMGDTASAWELCRQGLKELPDSRLLRIQYIRMQCASPETDRQVCAQTIRKFLREVPEIAEEPEFKKLQEEYEIKVEGEEVWVGK